MPASFDGNDGNDGNAANSGGAGNATSISSGWFFADRVNLPFVTTPDTGPNATNTPEPIGGLTIVPDIARFPARNWSAEWYSWLALIEFAASKWQTIDPTSVAWWPNWVGGTLPIDWPSLAANVEDEIAGLAIAAANERADALGEILSQANEFISYFLNLLTANPGAYPQTTKVLSIASQIGTFVAMYFKGQYKRPRPSQLCPALLPPLQVPGHASFPSGHSTQAHLMALCMGEIFDGLPAAQKPQMQPMRDDLKVLADRIARNREIAGLHYPSDTAAGVVLANQVLALLSGMPAASPYRTAVTNAVTEWTWP
jgi:membrane-associated phospholipid phosphatase